MGENAILIVDDVDINREILKEIFEEQFSILEAEDGEKAIRMIQDHLDNLALVLLDLQMPKVNGLEVLKFMNEIHVVDKIPVIMITGESTVSSDVKAYELGAADIIYKPFAQPVVIRRAINIMELFEHRNEIEQELRKRTKQLRESQAKLEKNNEFLINALSSVVEFRSLESGEHIQRVKYFTGLLLKYLMQFYPEYHLTIEQCKMISDAAALHDLGKIAIPDSILLKPARLTEEEFEIMKTHSVLGCELLENFRQEDNEFYQYCYDICRYHHEKYDGNGYPDHLVGEQIPIWAQVVSIVDVFDALVSKRVYKTPYAVEEAEAMILNGECGKFSDKIIDCFEMAKAELFAATEEGFSFIESEQEL